LGAELQAKGNGGVSTQCRRPRRIPANDGISTPLPEGKSVKNHGGKLAKELEALCRVGEMSLLWC